MRNHPYSIMMPDSQVIQNLLAERDTLKAKEKLLDEIVPIAQELLDDHDTCYCYDSEVEFRRNAEHVLSKAKELK